MGSEDADDYGDEDFIEGEPPIEPARGRRPIGVPGMPEGLVDITTLHEQLRWIAHLPGIQVEVVDVTDSPDVPEAFKTGVKGPASSRSLLMAEPLLRPGRIYKFRMKQPATSDIQEFKFLVRNINVAAATERAIDSSLGRKAKRFVAAYMTFWTSAARTAKSAVARDVTLSKLYDDGAGTSFLHVLRSIPGDTSGDLTIVGDPESEIWVGQLDQFRLQFSQPASDVFVDAFLEVEVG